MFSADFLLRNEWKNYFLNANSEKKAIVLSSFLTVTWYKPIVFPSETLVVSAVKVSPSTEGFRKLMLT